MKDYPHYLAGMTYGREVLVRTLIGYIGAVVVAHIAGAAAAAQHVIKRYEGMTGNVIGFGERLSWTQGDVIGMATGAIFPVAIAVALLLAFAVAGFVVRRVGGLRTFGFVLAGALGMLTMHLVLNSVTGINPVAATRDLVGLGFQSVAGALAGAVYVLLHPARSVNS